MLNRDEIHERLRREEIFRPGTWSADSLSGASYDLRMAEDFLIGAGGVRYPTGNRVARLVLSPGDVVMISTRERFCIPWDLVGNMSPKFSSAKKGLLIHTGSIVDPGFGLREDPRGSGWVAADDERVHFFIANVGDQIVELKPLEKVATIQFSEINPPTLKVPGQSKAKIEADFFSSEARSVSARYFALLKESDNNTERRANKVEKNLASLTRKVVEIESGYRQVTLFGIYVLSAALLTIFVALILDGIGKTLTGIDDASVLMRILVVVVLLFLLGFPVYLVRSIKSEGMASEL